MTRILFILACITIAILFFFSLWADTQAPCWIHKIYVGKEAPMKCREINL